MNFSQLPSIWFLYGDYWMEVRPEDYTMSVTDDKCSFCFEIGSGEWELGTSFVRGWYSVYSAG